MTAVNNAVDQKFVNNADGFSVGGGTTERDLTVTGGNVTIIGAGSAVVALPTTSSTLATLDLAETFTGQKTLTGGLAVRRRAISDAAYTQVASDSIIAYTTLTAARIVTLITAGIAVGQVLIIKDEAGTAGANNITVSGVNIDGASSKVINANFGVLRLYYNGSVYFTI